MLNKITIYLIGFLAISNILFAQVSASQISSNIVAAKNEVGVILENAYNTDKQTTLALWNWAEVGFKENKSAQLHIQHLKEAGFKVEAGVGGMPTAFVATFGSGKPVIGILAEYDALPGLSQTSSPVKSIIEGKAAGHGCGHDLFGTGSVSAAIAIKQLIAEGKIKGTIKLYGSPAEEGGGGKVYLVRAGLFNDVDAVIHWHPSNKNEVTMKSALAYKSAKFRFYGISAHAAAQPEQGRRSGVHRRIGRSGLGRLRCGGGCAVCVCRLRARISAMVG